jgi:myosin tail region-interacting protein MTI1
MATDITQAQGSSIVTWLNGRSGQTIDRGECWDAAERGIQTVGARRPNSAQLYVWGRVVTTGSLQVGDILQFNNFTVRVTEEDGSWSENSFGAPRHTAIVSYINSDGSVDVLHQNYDGVRSIQSLEYVHLKGGKVGSSTVTVRSGSVTCYRPQRP